MDKLPVLSLDLIKRLDEIFPLSVPPLGTPAEEVWFNFGRRAVVEHLLSLANQLNDNILEQTP